MACLGIDFGTCYSSAAVLVGNRVEPVPLRMGVINQIFDMPTAILIDKEGQVQVGESAVRQRHLFVENYLDKFKLRLGSMLLPRLGGKEFQWSELTAHVLRYLKEQAEKQYNNGRPFEYTVIAVPALYVVGGNRWQTMLEAAELAGFAPGSFSFIREPEAAAAYYGKQVGHNQPVADEITLVYDLGGGTFDPALVRTEANGSFSLIGALNGANHGEKCGGIYFDDVLRQHFLNWCRNGEQAELLKSLQPLHRSDYSADEQGERAFKERRRQLYRIIALLDNFVVQLKHELSGIEPKQSVWREDPIKGLYDYSVRRSDYEDAIAPLLFKTLDCSNALIGRCGLEWKQLNRILLVGGSCNIPLVRQLLEQRCKLEGAQDVQICWRQVDQSGIFIDPLTAVAQGAAWHCATAAKQAKAKAMAKPLASSISNQLLSTLGEGAGLCGSCNSPLMMNAAFCSFCGQSVQQIPTDSLPGELLELVLPNNISLTMVWCPAGEFMMGSPETELGREGDEEQHLVTLTRGFWIGKYAVTQEQYLAVTGSNPSSFTGDSCPVECVSWNEAMNFCTRAQELMNGGIPSGYRLTLPTEAQWEYACRAGTISALHNGLDLTSESEACANLDQVGWFDDNSNDKTQPVGKKAANAWGLHDMLGNVW